MQAELQDKASAKDKAKQRNPQQCCRTFYQRQKKKDTSELKVEKTKNTEKQKSEAMLEERRYKQIDKDTGPLRNLARGLLLDL